MKMITLHTLFHIQEACALRANMYGCMSSRVDPFHMGDGMAGDGGEVLVLPRALLQSKGWKTRWIGHSLKRCFHVKCNARFLVMKHDFDHANGKEYNYGGQAAFRLGVGHLRELSSSSMEATLTHRRISSRK